MKHTLDKGFFDLKGETYLNLLIILAPLMNFLSGISIDLYVPSMPALTRYFSVSPMLIKNTITITMVGFAIGCLVFGTLMDHVGRRRTILLGLVLFTIASFAALFCQNISQFMMIRFIQGMAVSVVSVGGRALIVDNFTGPRYVIGLVYVSFAFALGPIIGPFIGGMLQYHFGWKANFIAYGVFSTVLMIIFASFIHESLPRRSAFSLKKTASRYLSIIRHSTFIAGAIVTTGAQLILVTYPTVGPFIVENILHRTSIAYGNTALMVSFGYFLGTLTMRILMKKFHLHHLARLGYAFAFLGWGLQICFVFWGTLTFFTLILPIAIMGFSMGFIFPNVWSRVLRLFPDNVGVATAILTSALMLFSAVGVFFISRVEINSLKELALIFGLTIVIQFVFFVSLFKNA